MKIYQINHIYVVAFLLFSFWDITSDLIGYLFYILKENWQNVHFGIGGLLNW